MFSHGDLFTGIGGFSIAAGRAGFRTVFFSEINSYCSRLLAERWPGIPNLGDILSADFSRFRGHIDVLSAGVPCQPASLAGKRRGAKDDRWLWSAALDVVECVRPTWTIFENPPGILSLDEFAGIYLRLESLGYEIAPPLSVPANAVGAKHRRQRVFIVANRACQLRNGSGHAGQRWRIESADGGEALADAVRARLEIDQPRQPGQCAAPVGSGGFDGTRESEPGVRKLVNGVSAWMDGVAMPKPLTRERIKNRAARLKALGNSIVPEQAYPFFKAIYEVEMICLNSFVITAGNG